MRSGLCRSMGVVVSMVGLLWLMPALVDATGERIVPRNNARALLVGSELDYPPYATVNAQGEADGFSVDLFKAVAQVMGLEVTFRVGPWHEMRAALERGEIDALPLVSYSEERERVFDFSAPHTDALATVMIRKGDPAFTSERDLYGKKIIVMQADATHDYLVRHQISTDLILAKTVLEVLQRLSGGEGDVAFVARLPGLLEARARGLDELVIATGPAIAVHGRGYGFAVRKGNSELLDQLNHGLAVVKAAGKYAEIYDKWFGMVDPRGISLETLHTYGGMIGGGILFVLAVGLLWNSSLRREIQQRRVAEERLEQSNHNLSLAKEAAEAASQAKSLFLANMSHEFRTPLHAILGFNRLLLCDVEVTARQKEYLEVIQASASHLLTLIQDVLEMSRIEAGRMELHLKVVDLKKILTDVADMMRIRAEEKGLMFHVKHDADLPHDAQTDGSKLRQVLINLLSNAIKFTEKGTVTLRAGLGRDIDMDGPRELWCEVEDSGVGIPAEALEKIFEPFTQISHSPGSGEGTGLGLTITRHYLRLLGGDVEVTSSPGHGSIFRCRVPIVCLGGTAVRDLERAEVQIIGLEEGERIPRILVVDDLPAGRLMLRRLMEAIGCQVEEAVNGQQAVERFLEWHPDLIWMDMRMPVMDGYQATRQIKSDPQGRQIPVIAVTASVLGQDMQEIQKAGCDDFLGKPFQESDIYHRMVKHLPLRYRYQQKDKRVDQAIAQILSWEVFRETFTALPPELCADWRQAVALLQMDQMSCSAQAMQAHDPKLAEGLLELIDHYQLEVLARWMAWLDGATSETWS
ncbi:MAG: transporter substrate-binding domain-containing protein [Magnetococcales bacterium]|nr:transporter substrate-binding domain-containing protein [Magnetococcales bacterium]